MQIPSEKELFKAGAHFGHRPSSWHPQMANFIFGSKNGVHIIDLEKTRQQLSIACEFVKQTIIDDKQILFVGTRIQNKKIIEKYAQQVMMPYVSNRWLGGTLTNFKTIRNLVKKLENLENQTQQDDYEKKYTKKERLDFSNEIHRLENMIGGIRHMTKMPSIVFLASARYQKTVINEAAKKNIPLIAICDTNSNPKKINYPLPANDDALKSVELIVASLASSIKPNTSNKK